MYYKTARILNSDLFMIIANHFYLFKILINSAFLFIIKFIEHSDRFICLLEFCLTFVTKTALSYSNCDV